MSPNQPSDKSNQEEIASQQSYNTAQQGVIDATGDYVGAVNDLNTAQNNLIQSTGDQAAATAGVLTQVNAKFQIDEGVATNPTNDAKGTNQHLMIYVPTHKTRMNMGHQYPDYKFYNGFCAHTEADVLISAYTGHSHGDSGHGHTTENAGVFESKGHAVFQTLAGGSAIYCNAKGAGLISGQNVVISGKKGVCVFGGFSGLIGPPVVDPRSGGEPAQADMGGQTAASISKVGNDCRLADSLVAALCASSANQARKDNSKSSGHLAAVAAVTGGLNSVVSGLDAVGGVAGAGGAIGGTVLYGDIAMILGTPAYASIYGAIGVRLASTYSAAVYGLDVGAFGGFEARMASPKVVELTAALDCEVVGSSQVLAASREGPTFIEGDEVLIGRKREVGTVCVGTTMTGGLNSESVANLLGTTACHVSSEDAMVVAADKKLGISSEKVVGMGVGAAHLTVNQYTLNVRAGGGALPAPPPVSAPPDKIKFVNEVTASNNALKGHFEGAQKDLDGYGKELAKKGKGDAEIQISKSKIILKFKGKVMKGTASKWTVNGKDLIVKK